MYFNRLMKVANSSVKNNKNKEETRFERSLNHDLLLNITND